MYPDIADYAVIGDARSAALVSCHGSIDWLCLPRFDSPSLFNRLLDARRGGYFTISPSRPTTSRRWYEDQTAVLVTEFQTETGCVQLKDFVPALTEAEKATRPLPLWSLVRQVEGLEGTMELDVVFSPRPSHGRVVPQLHRRNGAGYFADLGSQLLHLATDAQLEIRRGEAAGRVTARAGELHTFWFAFSVDAPAVYPPLPEAAGLLQQTLKFWRHWTNRCRYQGPYRKEILRSAITLKLLSFAPSGAIVAAPTTSLPEVIGGVRNWDYRYCWLRDAAYTARVFSLLGYQEEASAFILWLLHATTLTYPALQVLYDLCGEASIPQRDLQTLEGYRASSPVRVGNQAYRQFQLDVYGEVLDAVLVAVEAGFQLDREMRRRLVRMADLVSRQWMQPDHGIWEIPGRRQHYVHSKVLCWVALDRAIKLSPRLGLAVSPERWEQAAAAIRETVLAAGFSHATGSFVQRIGDEALDATGLTFAAVGFLDPKDKRFGSTIESIRTGLSAGDLVYRYQADDGLPGKEGAFLACSFWLVEALALQERRAEAETMFQRLQRRANDVGLYSEEVDPLTGGCLGNFPQALSHLAHVAAALRLSHTG